MPSSVTAAAAPSSFAWGQQQQVASGGALKQQQQKDHDSPPEVVAQQPRLSPPAPVAPPGSHSSALQVTRQGLKMSPPSRSTPSPSSSGLSLAKRSWNNPPEIHLWSVPAQKRKRAGAPGRGVRGTRLPLQSPVRRAEWWRRPPSPLVSHMRPLWESNSGSEDFVESFRERAPEEGEVAAGVRRHHSQVWQRRECWQSGGGGYYRCCC